MCVCMSEYGSHHASETPDKLDSLFLALARQKAKCIADIKSTLAAISPVRLHQSMSVFCGLTAEAAANL